MTRRIIFSLAAILGVGACTDVPTNTTETPAGPDFVLYGQPDGNAHPYVGLLLFFVSGVPSHFCTGSALDGNTILTAGHCTDGTTEAHFYQFEKPLDEFPSIPAFFAGGSVGTPITYPGFDFSEFPNTGDVGVVQLTSGTAAGPFPQLPALNELGDLSKHNVFEIVGYGLEDVRPVEVFNVERVRGQVTLVNAKSGFSGGFNLHLSSNNGRPHRGGLCFGDSGGPVLEGDKIFGVNSFVINSNCAGSGYSYRVDIDPVRAWIIGQL